MIQVTHGYINMGDIIIITNHIVNTINNTCDKYEIRFKSHMDI